MKTLLFALSAVRGFALSVVLLFAYPAHAVEADKKLHFFGGLVIGASTTVMKDRRTGILVGCGVGLLKEMLDTRSNKHTADPMDFAYTCLGAVLAAQGVHKLKLRAKERGVMVEWRIDL